MEVNETNSDDGALTLAETLESSGALRAASGQTISSFCCACCRVIWEHLPPIAQEALQVIEQYREGNASEDERNVQFVRLWQTWDAFEKPFTTPDANAIRAVLCCYYDSDKKDREDEFDLVTAEIDFCNAVKKIPDEVYCQLMRQFFGSD